MDGVKERCVWLKDSSDVGECVREGDSVLVSVGSSEGLTAVRVPLFDVDAPPDNVADTEPVGVRERVVKLYPIDFETVWLCDDVGVRRESDGRTVLD